MYHHKAHHSARVKHILASHSGQGKAPAKKKFGGSAGMKAYARGNNSADLQRDEPEIEAEGHKGRHRYARGGKAPKVRVTIKGGPHLHLAPGMMGPGAGGPAMPPPGGAPMPPPGMAGPGLMAPGMAPGQPPMVRNQGGAVHAGSGTGVSRLSEFHRLRREGH